MTVNVEFWFDTKGFMDAVSKRLALHPIDEWEEAVKGIVADFVHTDEWPEVIGE